jgi:Predicted hydrolase (HAD superfamily)
MYSFDIYDTLITRTTATPKGIFAIMNQILQNSSEYMDLSEHIRKNFYDLRIHAENIARLNRCDLSTEEVNISQIYQIMGMCGVASDEELIRLQELEIETELNNVIGIFTNIEKVRYLLNAGAKVILISDMYLGEEIIRKTLVKLDSIFATIPIYVSCDYGKTKLTGKLYEIIAEKENQGSFAEWWHVGDNEDADILSAASYGIKTEYYSFGELKSYEKQLLDKEENNMTTQLAIGCARNARMLYQIHNAGIVNRSAYEIGCSIGGAILFPYVAWILRQCEVKGIERLYFMARDGYVIKKIADKIIDSYNLNIRTFYFYGSRKAIRMPSLDLDFSNMEQIVENSFIFSIHTLEEIADLFEVPIGVIKSFYPASGLLGKKKLSMGLVKKIVGILCKDDEFMRYVYEIQQEKKKLLVSYIRQEVKEINYKVAFVELFGNGLTQECLAKVCKEISDVPLQSFYLNKLKHRNEDLGVSYVYLPANLPFSHMIEVLCRAPHGQTNGYKKENHLIIPVLSEGEEKLLKSHGYDFYIDGVIRFTETYIKAMQSNQGVNMDDDIRIYLQYFQYITQTPDEEILNYFGDMPFDHTGRNNERTLFAPRLSKEQLQQIFLTRYNEPIELYYNGCSLEYSLLRCTEEERELVERYKRKNKENNWKRTLNSYPGIDVGWGCNHAYADEYDLIAQNIIIYGAGKRGQLLYSQLMQRAVYNIVAWIDKNYEKYDKLFLKVESPMVIKQMTYDQIVIGVLDEGVADEIMTELVQLGISNRKILWVRPEARQ